MTVANPPITARSTLGQVLPPLALFLPLVVADPTTFAVLLAAVVLVMALSLGRLVWLAIRRPPPGTRWLGSVLAVAFALAVSGLSWLEIAPVAGYVNGLAGAVQGQCATLGKCPGRISGWTDARQGSDTVLGKRVRYSLAYRSDGATFRLCWQVAFGRCRSATGGADVALAKVAALPWPQAGTAGAAP